MKKFILGALAATMVVGPVLAAPAVAQYRGDDRRDDRRDERRDDRHDDRRDDRRDVRGYDQRGNRGGQFRSFQRGQRFDQRYARNYRQIDYRAYRGRGIYAPPRGYRWVQSGNDALLVGITSGIIGAVIGGAIR